MISAMPDEFQKSPYILLYFIGNNLREYIFL